MCKYKIYKTIIKNIHFWLTSIVALKTLVLLWSFSKLTKVFFFHISICRKYSQLSFAIMEQNPLHRADRGSFYGIISTWCQGNLFKLDSTFKPGFTMMGKGALDQKVIPCCHIEGGFKRIFTSKFLILAASLEQCNIPEKPNPLNISCC